MNERIKQLVLQSQLVYETTDGKVYNSWEDYVDLTEYVEKFAELIVKECLNIIQYEANGYAEPVWAYEIVNDIKERFDMATHLE